jgi:hypothetical protein
MKINIIKRIFPILLAFVLVVTPVFVFGGDEGGDTNLTNSTGVSNPSDYQIPNPIGVNSIQEFIRVILEGVIKIGFPIVALAIIYSGFLFVTAQGSEDKLKKAKRAITYSIIGAAILLGSWTLSILISETIKSLGQ